jgi:hypothetical protein
MMQINPTLEKKAVAEKMTFLSLPVKTGIQSFGSLLEAGVGYLSTEGVARAADVN